MLVRMNAEEPRARDYRPEKVFVNPDAWDGERAHLMAVLDLVGKVAA